MKFLCDDNLGKLARFLRLLGYDTAYRPKISDAELIALMLKEDRFVITRDHHLIGKIELERLAVIESDSPEQQLQQIIKKLDLKIDRGQLFSRCLICNEVCLEVDKEQIKDRVFPFVLRTHEHFRRCPSCERIYWRGSHYENMVSRLQKLLDNSI